MQLYSKLITTAMMLFLCARIPANDSPFTGPKGERGPKGPRGAMGASGETGPNIKFLPAYAVAYLNYDASGRQKAVRSDIGEQIIPFTEMGDHSDLISLDSSTHELSLPSGVYKVSYQFMFDGPSDAYPQMRSVYMTLIPSVGTPSRHPIDMIRSFSDRFVLRTYTGEGIVEVPDNTNYKATLSFLKQDSFSYSFGDSDVTNTTPDQDFNNFVHIAVVKIAEYQAP